MEIRNNRVEPSNGVNSRRLDRGRWLPFTAASVALPCFYSSLEILKEIWNLKVETVVETSLCSPTASCGALEGGGA